MKLKKKFFVMGKLFNQSKLSNQSNCITFHTLLSFCCKLIWFISDSTIRNQYNISFTSLSSCWSRNHTETHTRWSRALTYCSGLVINFLIPYSFIGTSYKYFQSNFTHFGTSYKYFQSNFV